MILKALCDYYDRKRDAMPPFGTELKEIAYIIVIDRDGKFVRLEDRRIDNRHAQTFIVKRRVIRSGQNWVPNFLWDNSMYVFCYSDKKGDNTPKFQAFKQLISDTLSKAPGNPDLNALARFYKQTPEQILAALQTDSKWNDIAAHLNQSYSWFSFLIDGESEILSQKAELIELAPPTGTNKGICLISGGKDNLVLISAATPIVGGKSNGKLLAFQTNSGYDSYGREQGENAPTGEQSEFKYSTALISMLADGSRNKFRIGNRTFLFWASTDSDSGVKIEDGLFSLFGFAQDNPDANIEEVRDTFKSIYSGKLDTNLEDRFHILGLAPNAARIAVSFWSETSLRDFAEKILRHFEDMEIIDGRKDPKPYEGLYAMLAATAVNGDVKNASPNLPEQIAKSIFQGLPYPFTLYIQVLKRIRAQQDVYITQAAIIKAYLNRLKNNNDKPLTNMLDTQNTNQGYLCGRLFAVLVAIQERANGISTIRERYISAAGATPAAVFPTILNLSVHHSEKLNEGSKVYYEKLKQEIIDKIESTGFPTHLDLQDQGRFVVGYYHQRQELFRTKDAQNEQNKTN